MEMFCSEILKAIYTFQEYPADVYLNQLFQIKPLYFPLFPHFYQPNYVLWNPHRIYIYIYIWVFFSHPQTIGLMRNR